MSPNEKQSFGTINIPKLMEVLSEILSEKYGAKITITARRKDEAQMQAAG